MSPIKRIALRRIKRSLHKSIFLSISVFFSMFIVSLFAFFQLHSGLVRNPEYENLPFGEWLSGLKSYMIITSVLLIMINVLQIRIQLRVRAEENRETLAVLTSVGASAWQKRGLMMTEIKLLYLIPTAAGVLFGIFPGIFAANSFMHLSSSNIIDMKQYIDLAVKLLLISLTLILLFSLLPSVRLRKSSVISEVKKQNNKASNEKHNYMQQSRTFREQAAVRRLAKKSTMYYSRTYNRIALSFALAAMYPVIAAMMFVKTGNQEIIIDDNPFDGIDTSVAVYDAVFRLMIFLLICFLVLTAAAVLQTALTVRTQYLERRRSAKIYLTIGMPEDDIRKMILYEFLSLGIRIAVSLFLCSFSLISVF